MEHYPINRIGQREVIRVPISFETNEVGAFELSLLPYRCKLVSVKSVVTKTVAGSNDATIDVKKGSTSYAQVTVAASAAIGDEDEDTSITDTPFELDEQIKIETAKSTAGGRGILFLEVEILPSH